MLGRLALCSAAAIALLTLSPAHSSAKGFLGAPMHHAGAFHFLNRHGHGHRFGYRRHDRRNDAYAGGYWPFGYAYGDSAAEPGVVPLAYPIYLGPRCLHSVETVIVPAELGGERRIRITRC